MKLGAYPCAKLGRFASLGKARGFIPLNNSNKLVSLGEVRELTPLGEAREFSLAELESCPLLAKLRDSFPLAELENWPLLAKLKNLFSSEKPKGFYLPHGFVLARLETKSFFLTRL